jgi:hypothetical protein
MRMVMEVVGGSATVARESGTDTGYVVYYFLSLVYRLRKKYFDNLPMRLTAEQQTRLPSAMRR